MSGNVGTIEFRAPEVIVLHVTKQTRSGIAYDERVDVWGAGLILFEMMALVVPYRVENISPFDLPAHIARGVRPRLPRYVVDDDGAGSSHADSTLTTTNIGIGIGSGGGGVGVGGGASSATVSGSGSMNGIGTVTSGGIGGVRVSSSFVGGGGGGGGAAGNAAASGSGANGGVTEEFDETDADSFNGLAVAAANRAEYG